MSCQSKHSNVNSVSRATPSLTEDAHCPLCGAPAVSNSSTPNPSDLDGDVTKSSNLNLKPDGKAFGLMIILVAFTAVEVMLGKMVMFSHVFASSFSFFRSHLYIDPLQAELGHSDVTRSLFEVDTTAPQSIKHLKSKEKHKEKRMSNIRGLQRLVDALCKEMQR